MGKIIFKAYPREFKAGCLLIPATPSDKRILDAFCRSSEGNYITVTANLARNSKTYDQCKTIFALINLLFEIKHDRKPTEQEQAVEYTKLLWKYADRIEDIDNPDNSIPISLSHMSVIQAAHFINSIMAEVYEFGHGQLSTYQEVELKTLFEEFNSANNCGNLNPIDYDKEGNLLTEAEWREKNHFSFASGVVTEDLQLAHILSRGAHEKFRDCPWNWLMLTDYEHNRIQHAKGGWQKLLELYPHLAPRVKNAYDQAKELYPHEIQVALIKLGYLNEYIMEDDDD